MRRAAAIKKQEEMDALQNHHNHPTNGLPTKFYNKFMAIPVIQFGVHQASAFYGKVKDFNVVTHKSFELAESVTGAVVGRVTPLAQRGMGLAGQFQPLHRIDDLAAQGLQNLEDKVPVIKQEPQVMVSDVKGAVTVKVNEAKDVVSKASERVLVSRPVQTYFDFLTFILHTAENTLDRVLPPSGEEARNKDNQQSQSEENKADRGWSLLSEFFGLLHTVKNRVTERVRTRIETTASAADAVFNEAKKAANHALPVACDKDLKEGSGGGSGEPNKTSVANKAGKKKKHENQHQPQQHHAEQP